MLIGLTGGIASGKSTVSKRLAARGAKIVDADVIAREVVEPGSTGLAEVVKAFGADILDGDALNRVALGARVFGDPAALARLQSILHPLIAAESMRQIQAAIQSAKQSETPLVVYDAPLLIEAGRAEMFRPLVVVTAPRAVQRARIMVRDGLDASAADTRIDAQMPVAEKAAMADHIIDNGGDLDALDAQIAALWETLVHG